MLLSVEPPVHPEQNEQEVNRRREAAYDEVVTNLRRKPLGAIRAEIFKFAFDITHQMIVVRDNERCVPTDLTVMAIKRAVLELGRRLHERGLVDAEQDVYFLGWGEAWDLLEGRPISTRLLKAKIAARARDIDRILKKEFSPPRFLKRGRELVLDEATGGGDGVFIGTPTSPGVVTARARVIKT